MVLSTLSLKFPESLKMTDQQFFEFCQENLDLRIERDRHGVISIMSPVGSESGNREAGIIGSLWAWAERNGTGIVFSSSAGFKLSTGAERSPDAAWMTLVRWNAVPQEQRTGFALICPDFVVELRSPSDNLKPLQEKMEEYLAEPGCRLGILIDRKNRDVYVYRPGQAAVCFQEPEQISAEPELPGFVLNLRRIW